jgi:hypothetical protein
VRRLIAVLAILVGLVCVLFLGIGILSESGEVVVLQTVDAEGRSYETRLWIVEDAGRPWLRAGNPSSRWYAQLTGNPDVKIERGEQMLEYRAVPVEAARERINSLMEEKYGTADRLIGIMADRSDSVPIRLDTR